MRTLNYSNLLQIKALSIILNVVSEPLTTSRLLWTNTLGFPQEVEMLMILELPLESAAAATGK
jgi:hypothetical protein